MLPWLNALPLLPRLPNTDSVSFSKQLKDTEKAEKAIEITENIDIFYTESIKKFNESIDNVSYSSLPHL